MTDILIPLFRDAGEAGGSVQLARVTVALVDAELRPRIGWRAGDGVFVSESRTVQVDPANLGVGETHFTLSLLPQSEVAAEAVTYYRIEALIAASRTVESWLVQVPDSPNPLLVTDLIAGNAVSPADILAGRVLTLAERAALNTANNPSGDNPFMTLADVAGASGHQIQDGAGTVFPPRAGLRFVGATVTDDGTGNRTVVSGLQGPAGPAGPQGVQGAQGAKGDAGSAGATGPKGDVGDAGATGAAGLNGWTPVSAVVTDGARRVYQVVDWTGGTGTKPATGLYVGAAGWVTLIADAVDVRGPAGATGAAGAAGAQGPQGPQGPAGADGAPGTGVAWHGAWSSGASYAALDGVQHNGSSWIANTSNTNAAPGVSGAWDLWVAKGDTGSAGAQGPKGDTGSTGPTGTAATIAVGTVTTGAAGSSATVTNAGSSSAAVFNFSIPQGAAGAAGTAGATGPTGPAGPTGSPGATGPQGPKGDTGDSGYRARAYEYASGYHYQGSAPAGSATSATVWTIHRMTISTAGAVTANLTATNVAWTNRASATYT